MIRPEIKLLAGSNYVELLRRPQLIFKIFFVDPNLFDVVPRFFGFLQSMDIWRFDIKRESGTLSRFGENGDLPVKFVYNFLANKKPQSDALGVHLLGTFQIAEHFEKFLLVGFADSDA